MEIQNIENENQVYFEKMIDRSPVEIRDFISSVVTEMMKLPQTETPLVHHFSKGVYAREIFLPKGTLIVGKIHKYQNLTVISAGDVSVLSIEGVKRVRAPFTFVSCPGVQRMVYAHEDTVWTTIHGTDEKDVDKIEEEFIAKSYDDVPAALEIEIKNGGIECLGE